MRLLLINYFHIIDIYIIDIIVNNLLHLAEYVILQLSFRF